MRHCCALLLLATLTLVSGRADAESILITWTGTVSYTTAPGPIGLDDMVSGSYVYDTDTSIATTGSNYVIYATGHDASFSVAGGPSGSFANNEMFVFDDYSGGFDQIHSRSASTSTANYSGDPLGFDPTELFLPFRDPTGTVFGSLDLPTSLDPGDFDFASLPGRIHGDNSELVEFTFTGFTATVLPEPSTALLVGLSLLAAQHAGRRRAR